MADDYLIWSNEHRAWWKPMADGYTTDVDQAARVTREVALRICGDANIGLNRRFPPNEIPVRLADADIAFATMARR